MTSPARIPPPSADDVAAVPQVKRRRRPVYADRRLYDPLITIVDETPECIAHRKELQRKNLAALDFALDKAYELRLRNGPESDDDRDWS